MSVARHHTEWLELVPHSGPFVSMTALLRVFPQGLDKRDPDAARDLVRAFQDWQRDATAPGKQRAWVLNVFHNFLGWSSDLLVEGQQIPPGLEAKVLEHGEMLRPDLVLVGPAGTPTAGKPNLLIQILDSDQKSNRVLANRNWKASPETRMAELLRATNNPLGLITNGEEWTLVFAQRGETPGFSHWYSTLWIEEQITLRAFQSLLDQRRFFGVAENDTLLGMLRASLDDQAEVTTSLGNQVRDAVEVLIRAFDKIDQDSHGTLLKGVAEKALYDASLTLMMRLVFLFSAEERGLLDLGKPLYDRNYAVSTLREQLQEVADQFGEEVLERRSDGWARLLAIFRAVHAGVKHQDLPIPEYQGSLFDPDRYPFLEGRALNTKWENTIASPLPINNRVVLHLLTSLQMLKMKLPGGGPATLRRVSFRGLDIEQIGHVYEGLLDYTAARAAEPILGLIGSKDIPIPFVSLGDLESWRNQGDEVLIEKLSEITKRTPATLKRAIEHPETINGSKLLIACCQDVTLFERAVRFASLIRNDSFEQPVVILTKGIHIAKGSDRRSTGTHYTPKSLTEPIVQHTLEPLVYIGPTEGLPKEEWRLRTPKEILGLKICDMAMGSGAFLVQTCRFLAERLVESWEKAEVNHPGEVLITPEGDFSKGSIHERLIPKEPEERMAIARRLITDRCLYGVDVNPMAVEMAKLSLWLITVQRDRPFTFVDHALKCGDSLLGVTTIDNIANFSIRPGNWPMTFAMAELIGAVQFASVKRSELERLSSNEHSQIENKSRLHAEVESATEKVKLLADCLVAFELQNLEGEAYEKQRVTFAAGIESEIRKSLQSFKLYTHELLKERRPFHWPLEFSEVFDRGGFDAFVGNPPFKAGAALGTLFGDDWRGLVFRDLGRSTKTRRGQFDLCVFFYLQACRLIRKGGFVSGIATNSFPQGDTKIIGLARLYTDGYEVIRAFNDLPWPGSAATHVCLVWITTTPWNGARWLDDCRVDYISDSLTAESESAEIFVLHENRGKAFRGTMPYGEGFFISLQEAMSLLAINEANSEALLPYLIGDDLNTHSSQQPSRYIINFKDWSLGKAQEFPELLKIVEERVKPQRLALPENNSTARHRRDYWWQFSNRADDMLKALIGKNRALAISRTTAHLAFAFVPTNIVLSERLVVIADDTSAMFGILQSTIHEIWAFRPGTMTQGTTRTYFVAEAFGTFPQPTPSRSLEQAAGSYYEFRQQAMQKRSVGLTGIYNLFHKQSENSSDVSRLRELHVEMDRMVAEAYGWIDLEMDHDFQETKQGLRFTVKESARREILDRLLVLNKQRYHEELKMGLHEKKPSKKSAKSKVKEVTTQQSLFSPARENDNGE
jgi:hypothetical protein